MKHVHADNMLLFAQDAMETDRPWDRWEGRADGEGEWTPARGNPSWNPSHQYRRKPRTIKVNGFDVPEPMREAPEIKSTCWLVIVTGHYFSSLVLWDESDACNMWLSRGLIHSTKEAAAKHAMAMCGIDPATYKEEE